MAEEHHEHHEEHHEHHEHHEAHHEGKTLKISKILIFQVTTAILAIVLIAVLVFGSINLNIGGGTVNINLLGTTPGSTTTLSGDKNTVSKEVLTYLNDNFQTNATITSMTESNGLYNMTLNIGGQSTSVYTSKDGKLVFPLVIDTSKPQTALTKDTTQATQQTTVQKSAKPVVQLFVMSHCPYGTQMEKGILPAVKQLGSKIDFTVKFVDYSMHGKVEINEELNQYCIETQFNSKYIDYLNCFLEDGNTSRCVAKVGIDNIKLASCISSADAKYNVTNLYNDKSTWANGQYPPFPIYATENTKYSVQGSPTLVINDVQVSAGRDSATLLSTICDAFTTAPAECQAKLSSAAPDPGFGGGTGTASTASCG
jgi:hypothetical protein